MSYKIYTSKVVGFRRVGRCFEIKEDEEELAIAAMQELGKQGHRIESVQKPSGDWLVKDRKLVR